MYLRWNTLQKSPNLCDDLTNRRSDRLIYCRRSNHAFSRQTAHTVNTDDFSRILRIFFQICKRYFQSSGCTFTDRKIKLSADRCQDILCQTGITLLMITRVSAITEISVVAAPMFTIMDPLVRMIGMPSASASAIGRSTRSTLLCLSCPVWAIL